MKRISVLLSLLLLLAVCFSFASCAGEGNVFALLSVRLNGNGDGTVTAVARNEFAVGSSVLPVELTLYACSENISDTYRMQAVSRTQTDDLDLFSAIEVTVPVTEPAYFCAEIVYTVHGETQVLQSGVVSYDASGDRVVA